MAKSKIEERVEAVIISGPRKGELITLANGAEPQLTPAEEAALDFAIEAAGRAAESAVALRVQTQSLGADLKRINKKYDGILGESSGTGGAPLDDRRGTQKRQERNGSQSKPNKRVRSKVRPADAAA